MSNCSRVLIRDLELGTYMVKLKALALCRPGEENSKGRYNCWFQLPEWIMFSAQTPSHTLFGA